MAFFTKKTKETTDKVEKTDNKANNKAVKSTKTVAKPAKTTKPKMAIANVAGTESTFTQDVLIRPRITEKAGSQAEKFNAYTFEVYPNATKKSIALAVNAIYKVKPIQVRIVNLKPKAVFVRGKRGSQAGIKKAIITLKKEDKIQLV